MHLMIELTSRTMGAWSQSLAHSWLLLLLKAPLGTCCHALVILPSCGYTMANTFDQWFHFRQSWVNGLQSILCGSLSLWTVLVWHAPPPLVTFQPTTPLTSLALMPAYKTRRSYCSLNTDGWLTEAPELRKYFGYLLPTAMSMNLDKIEGPFSTSSNVPVHNQALLK